MLKIWSGPKENINQRKGQKNCQEEMRPDNVEFILCYSLAPQESWMFLQSFKLFSKDNMVNRLDREVQMKHKCFRISP